MMTARVERQAAMLAARARVALGVVGLLLVTASTLSAAPKNPPPVPHATQGFGDCVKCHASGRRVEPLPADHAGRSSDSCLLCHDAPHATIPVDSYAATEACLACHQEGQFDFVARPKSDSDIKQQIDTRHIYAHRSLSCVACHKGDPHATLDTPINKASIAHACGQCHPSQLAAHRESVHGKSLESGGRDAATCIDCHSTKGTPHSIARVLSPDSPAWRGSIAATCAGCHAKHDVMEKYGVPSEVYKTYMSTFHGKANVLSRYEITQHPKATCTNCHGFHNVKSASDPTSPVYKANLATTCGTCHPGAGQKFAAAWMGHKEATPEQYPLVYWAERFFFYLTSGVLTFGFIFMVALDAGATLLWRRKSAVPTGLAETEGVKNEPS